MALTSGVLAAAHVVVAIAAVGVLLISRMDGVLLLAALMGIGALAFGTEPRLRHPFLIAGWFWTSIAVWHAASHPDAPALCERIPSATPCPLRNLTNVIDVKSVSDEYRHLMDVAMSITADLKGFKSDSEWSLSVGTMRESRIASVGKKRGAAMLAQACEALCRARRLETCINGTREADEYYGAALDLERMTRGLENMTRTFDETLRMRTVAQFYDEERPSLLQMFHFVWQKLGSA